MGLETLIEYANAQYAAKGIAQIQKVSTPWKVIRNGTKIVSAFPEKKSTVDYIGDYNGHSICFEAKSTENKTSFPLSNFEAHQIMFMHKWKGIKFAIIEFTTHKETYFIPFDYLFARYTDSKSIPYKWIAEHPKIGSGNGIFLDYLKHIDLSEVG
jgi:recombination protein U